MRRSMYPSHLLAAMMFISLPALGSENARCHVGAYRLDDGGSVAISPVDDPGQLRWRRVDGTTGLLTRAASGWTSTRGWTGQTDAIQVAFGTCSEGRIRFQQHSGRRMEFEVVETTFKGDGVALRGRLVMPKGRRAVPVVVEVHGSERDSALDFNAMQQILPAHGIGVFVYDKRGTGQSGGTYTQNFHLLADDASAALSEAVRLGGARIGRIGFHGGSQGGWIAPLAASQSPRAQFVVVGFGMANGALAEDQDQVMLDLRSAGYGDESILAKAHEVTDATAMIVASHGAHGWEQLERARAKYAEQPWWPVMKGEFTGLVAHHSRAEVEAVAPSLDVGTSWDYDPMPVLRALAIPQLWILAGSDREAPPQETEQRLGQLAGEGRPITTFVFPHTDHGIIEFETNPDGSRMETGYANGYLRMLIDWIHDGRLAQAPYGEAKQVTAPVFSASAH